MTTENATQSGAFESASSARSQAMAQIAKQVHERNAGDFNTFNEETGEIGARLTTTQPDPKPEATAQQPVQQEQADPENREENEQQQQEQQPQVAQTADDGLETIVIDGQERKVKREQIIEAGRRTLQKESAADKRLAEATETLRRAQAYEQGILARQLPNQDAGNQQPPSREDAANGTGDTDRQQATPDIGTLVDQRLWMHDANKAALRFQTEFKDIMGNPLLARLAAQLEDDRIREAAEQGKPLGDPWEAYKAHGERIRKEFKLGQPAETVQVSDDKKERKRDTVTVTGSTTTRPAPTQAKPPTTKELIEQMRVARTKGRPIQPAR